MDRSNRNFIVDLAAFVAFVLLAITGFLMEYVLPPGRGDGGHGGGHTSLWGMTRHDWGAVHYWIAIVLLALLALHLVLHWRWIAAMFRGKPSRNSSRRMMIGVAGLVGLAALCAALFLSPTTPAGDEPLMQDSGTRGQHGAQQEATHGGEGEFRGSTTLRQIEQQTGVPAAFIIDSLGLPSDTSPDERLGRLRQQHDFTMDEVRDAIERHGKQ